MSTHGETLRARTSPPATDSSRRGTPVRPTADGARGTPPVWMFLTLHEKAKGDDNADTAPAQAYDDMDTLKEYGDSDLGMGTDAAPKGQTVRTSYQRREAAENTVSYLDTSNSEAPRPREVRISY